MWVSLAPDITINFDAVASIIEKGKKYIRSGETPPKGVNVRTGKRGGRYYLTEDKHLKIQGKHHELVRSKGVTRDQWDELKDSYKKKGAKSVEFIPKPEYGKTGDGKPRYNIYVSYGEETQKKIEETLLRNKEKYTKKKPAPEPAEDPTNLEWTQENDTLTLPYVKQQGTGYVKAGTFQIVPMHHGGKLYFTGQDGKKLHVANAFQQTFKSGTDTVDETKSRENNLKALKSLTRQINRSGDSKLNATIFHRAQVNKEKENKPKKEYTPKNPLKELQQTLAEIRSGSIDPVRTREETRLQQEKGEMPVREFLVRTFAHLFPDQTPENIADTAAISLQTYDRTQSLYDTVTAGRHRLANILPREKPTPDYSFEKITSQLEALRAHNKQKDPRPLEEKLQTLHEKKKQPNMRLLAQYPTREGAEKAASDLDRTGMITDIREKKLGGKSIYNIYGRKRPEETPEPVTPPSQPVPQPVSPPIITVPHSDTPGMRGWVWKVTGYNNKFDINSGEFLDHDRIENGQKVFSLPDGLYESCTGPKYKHTPPRFFSVESGKMSELDAGGYQSRIRQLPYVNPQDAVSSTLSAVTKRSIPEEPFDPVRYGKDRDYQKLIDDQITQRNNPVKEEPPTGFVQGDREGEESWTTDDGTYRIRPTGKKGYLLSFSRHTTNRDKPVRFSQDRNELKTVAENQARSSVQGISHDTILNKIDKHLKRKAVVV